MRGREDEWTGLMRSAMAGDDAAYHRLLKAVTPVLRAAARRGLFAIGRNKLIDALRRRGRRVFVNIDDFAETLPGETPQETASAGEVTAQLNTLPQRQRDVLQSIAVDSASIKDTAAKFSMSEGAVRVALHRGLAALTAKLRDH